MGAAALHPARMANFDRVSEVDDLLESNKDGLEKYRKGASLTNL